MYMLYHSCEVYITFILTDPESEVSIIVIYTKQGWGTMMEPHLWACSAVLHTRCRSCYVEPDDHILKDWFEDYNSRNPSDTCPSETLTTTCSKEVLNKWLCVFINKTCSKTSDPSWFYLEIGEEAC